jgi:hypothetical protein
LAKRLGASARENAINNFDWRVIGKKVAVVYDSIMNRARRTRE